MLKQRPERTHGRERVEQADARKCVCSIGAKDAAALDELLACQPDSIRFVDQLVATFPRIFRHESPPLRSFVPPLWQAHLLEGFYRLDGILASLGAGAIAIKQIATRHGRLCIEFRGTTEVAQKAIEAFSQDRATHSPDERAVLADCAILSDGQFRVVLGCSHCHDR